jgi:hypothetical protein
LYIFKSNIPTNEICIQNDKEYIVKGGKNIKVKPVLTAYRKINDQIF